MDLNLTYSRNRWTGGSFHVSNPDKTVDFTIEGGRVQTGKSPLLPNIALQFEFTGTAPGGSQYHSQLLFSLVYTGNSRLEIRWADGTQDSIVVSGTSAVFLDISAKANGLLGVILDDGALGLENMIWEEYDKVAGKFGK